MSKEYKIWFNKIYADKDGNLSFAANQCLYPTRKGWLGCKNKVLNILSDSKIKNKKKEIEKL